jgi:hypothetical protein
MLLGKEDLISQYAKPAHLKQVYYEEPLDNEDNMLINFHAENDKGGANDAFRR